MDKGEQVEAWFERRRLTLDLANLTDDQRAEGSIFLGGSMAKYVIKNDRFEFNEVGTVLFRWGDPEAEEVFAQILEHDDNPAEDFLFPFRATALVGNQLWHLAVQSRHFDPKTAYRNQQDYVELPYDEEQAEKVLAEILLMPTPRLQQLIGHVGQRWVLFELGLEIHENTNA